MRLVIPEVINARGLIPFLAQVGGVADLEPEIIVDFAGVRRVSPAGLVALVAAIKRWQTPRAHRVRLEGLEACAIRGYLQRMDVLRSCGVDLPEGFERHANYGRFVPVQQILDVDVMSRNIAACLAPGGEDFEHPLSPIYDLAAYVLGELGTNVRQHSRGIGFVAAQTSAHEGLVRLAVADNGRGVRQSFVDAGFGWSANASDAAALRRAIEPRMSSQGEPVNQGVGLTLVTELARLSQAQLLIASGAGLLWTDDGGAIREQALGGVSSYHGTLVAMTFRKARLQDFPHLLQAAKQQAGLLVNQAVRGRFT